MPILPYPFGSVILNKSIITPSEGLLYKGDAGVTLSAIGVLLVMISSLTYAVYIVVVNQSSIRMSYPRLL